MSASAEKTMSASAEKTMTASAEKTTTQDAKQRRSIQLMIVQFILSIITGFNDEAYIKGGFVRDGGYLEDGGDWDGNVSDIDIQFNSDGKEPRDYRKFVSSFKEKISQIHGLTCSDPTDVRSAEYTLDASRALVKTMVSHEGVDVKVDIAFELPFSPDFDVNTLKLDPKKGIQTFIGNQHGDFLDIMNNIKKRQFVVLWDTHYWYYQELSIILMRIHKMEKRGWKCLNFKEIRTYFSGVHPVSILPKKDNRALFALTSFKKAKKDAGLCSRCEMPIVKGDYVPTTSWCGHHKQHHHRCVMSQWIEDRGLCHHFAKQGPTCNICSEGMF